MKIKRAIALLSGGLDSAVATALAVKDHYVVTSLTFDYGQRAALNEIKAAALFCKKFGIEHQVFKLPWLEKITNTALVAKNTTVPKTSVKQLDEDAAGRARAVWVPNRNGVFISVAAAIAESLNCETIIAGFNREEALTFPDNSEAFIEAINAALKFSTMNKVKVVSPTAKMNKDKIAKCFVQMNLSKEMLWSCYEGGDKPCEVCESCVRSMRAFSSGG